MRCTSSATARMVCLPGVIFQVALPLGPPLERKMANWPGFKILAVSVRPGDEFAVHVKRYAVRHAFLGGHRAAIFDARDQMRFLADFVFAFQNADAGNHQIGFPFVGSGR